MAKIHKKQRGEEKKTHLQPRTAKIISFVILTLMTFMLFLPMISAAEFDNSGDYHENSRTMEIKNLFGFGDPIANITLLSEQDHFVIRGEERLVAWYYIENYNDYDGDEVFDVIETFNIKSNMKPKEKNIQFKKKFIDYEEVPNHITVCNPYQDINETINNNCSRVQNGTKIKETVEWQPFNKNNLLEAGNYTIGLFTEVEPEEQIEWIPTMYGVDIPQWAGWTEALTVNLTRYYWFNDSTEELFGVYNYTNAAGSFNDTNGVGCIYGGCLGSDDTNYGWIGGNTDTDIGNGSKAFNFWMYAYAVNNHYFWSTGGNEIQMASNGDWYEVGFISAGGFVDGSTPSGAWTMVTLNKMENGTAEFWENGVKTDSVNYASAITLADWWIFIKPNEATGDNGIGYVDEMSFWNRTLLASEVAELYNGGSGITFTLPASVTNVTLNTPANTAGFPFNISTTQTNTFNCSAVSTTDELTNISLYHNASGTWERNETNVVSGLINETLFTITLPQNFTNWSCSAGDIGGIETFSGFNRTIFIDTLLPPITVLLGNGTFASGDLSINHTVNFSTFSPNIDTCIVGYNNINTTVPCTGGSVATTNFTMLLDGYNATIFVNDTAGHFNWAFVNWNFTLLEINGSANLTSVETKSETFRQNISTAGVVTSPKFILNGNPITATTIQAGTEYEFSHTLDIPLTTGSKGWFFNYTVDGTEASATNRSINISTMALDICNSSLTTIFNNFTFADETNLSKLLTGTIPLVSWTYRIGSGDVTKTLTFTNNTGNPEYNFCAIPNQTLITNYTLQYSESNGNYPQRIIEVAASLTNVTTQKTLYLLRAGEGQAKDVTFQVTNNAEQPLQNVNVVVNRTIAGTPTTIGEGNTNAAGGVTFFLNGDFEHTIVFTATGFETFTTVLFPTQAGYTIILGGNATTNFTSYLQGISFSLAPINTTLLNNTIYNFSFALNSTFWDVTSFGFVLFNSTGDAIGTKTLNTNGGNATLNLNTNNESLITMNYFWVIQNNYTNGTRSWHIVTDVGKDWSILTFRNDLMNYVNSDLFGLSSDSSNSFGLSIVLFFFIFVFTGIMSFKYGLVSPLSISSLVFSVVLFFDVGLGLMPTPVGAVPHFVTIIFGFVLVVIFLSEVRRL